MTLVDPVEFREALSRHPAGVVVITSVLGERRAALTVTSFTSASASPPLVSFYLKKDSSGRPVLLGAEWFAVNLLVSSHRDVAARCAMSGVDRFSPADAWSDGPFGLPLLKGATAHLVCRREKVVEVGDHFLIVGGVTEVSKRELGRPLLYCGRSYADLCQPNHFGQ
ncbi:flavin reductase family protein [Streptomyces platensis]|uniref:flavin reductase family protein n=1 Tax=Streptomyces platensis TaxID=58346 RepID=UPI002E2759FC|nr:flavin reductase family protein [Streptomyces platensis]WUB84575.1 flavin reductase family protein [Streptomyces platensis]